MQCETIMKREVAVVRPDEPIERAAQLMRDQGVGFLPVVDQDRKVVGALTDRDLVVRGLAEGQGQGAKVESVMTHEVIACSPGDDLTVAHQQMRGGHVSRIMCIDTAGRLEGVLSLSDLTVRDDRERATQTLLDVSEREAH